MRYPRQKTILTRALQNLPTSPRCPLCRERGAWTSCTMADGSTYIVCTVCGLMLQIDMDA